MDKIEYFCQEIKKALDPKQQPSEFAHLCVTSKPEFVIRDIVSSYFHSRLGADKIVAREWTYNRKRVDLAILSDAIQPELLIEFKAGIAEDAAADPRKGQECHELILSLCNDLERIELSGAVPAVGVMTFVHMTNPSAITDRRIDGSIVKYLPDHHCFSKRELKEGLTAETAITRVQEYLEKPPRSFSVSRVTTYTGEVWGSKVALHHLVIRRKNPRMVAL